MIGVAVVAEVSTVTVARVPTASKRHRRVSDVVVVVVLLAVQTMATELLAAQAEMRAPNLPTSGCSASKQLSLEQLELGVEASGSYLRAGQRSKLSS